MSYPQHTRLSHMRQPAWSQCADGTAFDPYEAQTSRAIFISGLASASRVGLPACPAPCCGASGAADESTIRCFSASSPPPAMMTFAPRRRHCLHRHLSEQRGRYLRARTHRRVGIAMAIDFAVVPRGYNFTGLTPTGRRQEVVDEVRRARRHRVRQPRHHGRHQREGSRHRRLLLPDHGRVHADDAADNQAKSMSSIDFSNWILTRSPAWTR